MGETQNDSLKDQVDQIRRILREDSARLSLWHRQPGDALYHVLAILEAIPLKHMVRAGSANDPGVSNHLVSLVQWMINGTSMIVHKIYSRSPELTLKPDHAVVEQGLLNQANQALEYATNMSVALDALEHALHGVRTFTITGNRITLPTVTDDISYLAALSIHPMLLEHRRGHLGANLVEEIEGSPNRERIVADIYTSSVVSWNNQLSYRATGPLVVLCRDLVERATQKRDLPPSASVAGYSLDEFRTAFRVLYQRAQVHLAYCFYRFGSAEAQQVWNLPLWLNRQDLERELEGLYSLQPEVVGHILNDLTYAASEWSDISYQPLLPVGDGQFLASPSVISFSAWERNCLKLWANKYHDEYSRFASVHKREAERQLAVLFNLQGFYATSGRNLPRVDRTVLGDADVAVFDPAANILLLLEIKWDIEPGTAHEAALSDDRIRQGVAQVLRLRDAVRINLRSASQSLFKSPDALLNHYTDIQVAVVGRGYVGLLTDNRDGVRIWHFDLVVDRLKRPGPPMGLNEWIRELGALVDREVIKPYVARVDQIFELAGMTFVIDGFQIKL